MQYDARHANESVWSDCSIKVKHSTREFIYRTLTVRTTVSSQRKKSEPFVSSQRSMQDLNNRIKIFPHFDRNF